MISSFVLFELMPRTSPAFNLNGKWSIQEDITFQNFVTNEFKKRKKTWPEYISFVNYSILIHYVMTSIIIIAFLRWSKVFFSDSENGRAWQTIVASASWKCFFFSKLVSYAVLENKTLNNCARNSPIPPAENQSCHTWKVRSIIKHVEIFWGRYSRENSQTSRANPLAVTLVLWTFLVVLKNLRANCNCTQRVPPGLGDFVIGKRKRDKCFFY